VGALQVPLAFLLRAASGPFLECGLAKHNEGLVRMENSVYPHARIPLADLEGFYLSHVPLIWLCFRKLTGVSNPLRWTLFFSLQCLVPVLVYHAFENPMIQAGKAVAVRVGRRQHSPAMAAHANR
jgi:hypothetical protein